MSPQKVRDLLKESVFELSGNDVNLAAEKFEYIVNLGVFQRHKRKKEMKIANAQKPWVTPEKVQLSKQKKIKYIKKEALPR